MAIKREKSRGKELVLIEGPVTAFYINPIKPEHIKTYDGKNGPWTPTHRYNLVVDGQPISLGMGDKDGVSDKQQIRAKDNDDKFHTITKGMEVSVEVEELEPYNGKPQFRSGVSKVVIMDVSKAEAPPQQGQAPNAGGSYKPKDTTGMEVGHAVNAAIDYLQASGGDLSNENIVSVSAIMHNVTGKIKAEFAKANPEKSDYDVGAAVGHAVRNAARLNPEGDLESSVEALAWDILDNVSAKVEEFVKSGKGVAKPAKRTPAPAKAAGTRKAAKPAQEPVQDEPEHTGFDDMDDDQIPF